MKQEDEVDQGCDKSRQYSWETFFGSGRTTFYCVLKKGHDGRHEGVITWD
jgi:hypothetical protein